MSATDLSATDFDTEAEEYINKITSHREKSHFPPLSLKELEFYNKWAEYWNQSIPESYRKSDEQCRAPLILPIECPSSFPPFPPFHFAERLNNFKKTKKNMEERVAKRLEKEKAANLQCLTNVTLATLDTLATLLVWI